MAVNRALITFVLLFPLEPVVLRADSVLEYEVVRERTSFITYETSVDRVRQTISTGKSRGRLDDGGTSYVLRADLGKLWLLFHNDKTYWEFDTPVRLEAEVPEASRSVLEKSEGMSAAAVEVSATGEVETIRSWQARKWRVAVEQPLMGIHRDLEIWLETDLDPAVYRELRRGVAAFNVLDRGWLGEVFALEGIVVEYEEKSEARTWSQVVTQRLLSLREEEPGDDFYSVPRGYERKEFRLDSVFSVAEPAVVTPPEPTSPGTASAGHAKLRGARRPLGRW